MLHCGREGGGVILVVGSTPDPEYTAAVVKQGGANDASNSGCFAVPCADGLASIFQAAWHPSCCRWTNELLLLLLLYSRKRYLLPLFTRDHGRAYTSYSIVRYIYIVCTFIHIRIYCRIGPSVFSDDGGEELFRFSGA